MLLKSGRQTEMQRDCAVSSDMHISKSEVVVQCNLGPALQKLLNLIYDNVLTTLH